MKQETNKNVTGGYRPLKFFGMVFAMTWGSWFIASYLSYHSTDQNLYTIALLVGLLAPFVVTVYFMIKEKGVWRDFKKRTFEVKRIKVVPFLAICVIMGSSVVIAILISTLFGQSMDQLTLADDFKFSAGSVSVMLVMVLAPLLEEIGWRGYGVDALLSRFGGFRGSLLFGFLWSFWHFPLLFVKDYSVNVLLQENVWYAVNYFVSIIPLGIILNWLYIKCNRSTMILIVFHIFLNFMQVATKMTEFTSCIQTVVIIIFAVLIAAKNPEIFFPKLRVLNSEPAQVDA